MGPGQYERTPEIRKSISENLKDKPRSKESTEKQSKTLQAKYNVDHLIGQKFGRLTLIRDVGTSRFKDGVFQRQLEVECECGSDRKNVRKDQLLSGDTLSCGCLREENLRSSRWIAEREEIGFKMLLTRYKKGAKERNLCWELTDDQFRTLTKSNCWYTGQEPATKISNNESPNSVYVFNGVDRLDNTMGYTPENCVPCCKDANFAKMSLDYNKFLQLVERIYKFRIEPKNAS